MGVHEFDTRRLDVVQLADFTDDRDSLRARLFSVGDALRRGERAEGADHVGKPRHQRAKHREAEERHAQREQQTDLRVECVDDLQAPQCPGQDQQRQDGGESVAADEGKSEELSSLSKLRRREIGGALGALAGA